MKCSMKWFKRIYLLYIFGFFSNLRPLDPFLYKFLITYKNLTENQASYVVLPVVTYSSAVHYVLIFLFSTFCCFKSLIIISSLCSFLSTCLRIWSTSLSSIVASEVIRGIYSSTEIGYYISVYSYYDVSEYQHTTAFVRIVALLGKTVSAILAQYLLPREWVNYEALEYVHLLAIAIATVASVFLPAAKENVYEMSPPINADQTFSHKMKEQMFNFKQYFTQSFSQTHVIRWSIWLIWSIWSFNQISTFIQPIWEELHGGVYNGLVELCLSVSSLFFVILGGFKSINWKKRTIILMPLLSGFQYVIFLSGMAFSGGYILFNYVSYIGFGVIYYYVITAISAEVAKVQLRYCFGIVFGFIYLTASVLNAIMVSTVNNDVGKGRLKPQEQFLVYFIVFLVMYVIFFLGSEIKKRIDTVMVRHTNT